MLTLISIIQNPGCPKFCGQPNRLAGLRLKAGEGSKWFLVSKSLDDFRPTKKGCAKLPKTFKNVRANLPELRTT